MSFPCENRRLGGEPDNSTGSSFSFVASDDDPTALFALSQPATSTAVTPPSDTPVSPPPAGASPLPPTTSPAQPTDTVTLPTAAGPELPTATPEREVTPVAATQPASVPAPSTAASADTPTLAPTLQGVTTTTAIVEGGLESPATYTAQVDVPRGSLLDRLTRNKPGIWGSKAFYVGLAVVYVILLVLFFRLLFQLARQSD